MSQHVAIGVVRETIVQSMPEPDPDFGKLVVHTDRGGLGKTFTVQKYKVNASVDLYNVLNSDAVLNENSSYTVFRRPLSVVRPFFLKFGGQISF